jgi:hypothetical protein
MNFSCEWRGVFEFFNYRFKTLLENRCVLRNIEARQCHTLLMALKVNSLSDLILASFCTINCQKKK